jgi:transcriptional regulator with XRE-family HTH domain
MNAYEAARLGLKAALQGTQSDIAEKTGLTRQRVSDIMRGRSNDVGINAMARIAKGAGLGMVVTFVPSTSEDPKVTVVIGL